MLLVFTSAVIKCIIEGSAGSALTCNHPAVPLYAKVTLTNQARTSGTVATYACDEGYELFGDSSSVCTDKGKWSGDLPYCAVNVAYGKPTHQSSTTREGNAKNANDGNATAVHDSKYCTETRKDMSPWWQVDLLREYEIKVVRIVTRGCCGHDPLRDLEIRVGNSSTVQENRLCAWYPGNLEDGVTRDFPCAYPVKGRYVFIQMVGIEGSLSLCEVMVFTTEEISSGRCINRLEPLELVTFNRTCYEFQITQGGAFQDADEYCQSKGGLMVHQVGNISHSFLTGELERLKDQLKTKLVWLGAQRKPGLTSEDWRWVNDDHVVEYLWASDQPNNYNSQQNCVILDGEKRKWLWNDVTCGLNYLSWICQYKPSNCGSPDIEENTTISENDYRIGKFVTYQCPVGHMVMGERRRICGSDGFWTSSAPTCKYVNCGPLLNIKNGNVNLLESRTTFNATAVYSCDQNHTLMGNQTRVCASDGQWSGEEPQCLFNFCPFIKPPTNGNLDITGHKHGDTASYSCKKGHILVGDQFSICELGGNWTSEPPECKNIDCGIPPDVHNGKFVLLDQSTTYLSKVQYYCDMGFELDSQNERICLDTGSWEGSDPLCKMIECGEPESLPGSYVKPHNVTLNSTVQYICEPGHFMIGKSKRKCALNGFWTDQPPVCKYIDCGKVPPLLKGEVTYPNSTTFLNSLVTYSCSKGYKLIGTRMRHCEENGLWTGRAPSCKVIDCGVPPLISNGSWQLLGNTTYYESTVEYSCKETYKVEGPVRRMCLENSTWSGEEPICVEMSCGKPETQNRKMVVEGQNFSFGGVVHYSCVPGYHLKGQLTRTCQKNGQWSGAMPSCIVVDCKHPSVVLNGRGFLVNGTTTFGSIVEYECLPNFKMVGTPVRQCLVSGYWNGQEPRCEDITQDPHENTVDEKHYENQKGAKLNTSKTIGIAVAVGSGALLILIIIIVVVCIKTKKAKPVKNIENVDVQGQEVKDATVTPYSRFSIEPETSVDNYSTNESGEIYHHNNALVTYSGHPQTRYTNITVNGESLALPHNIGRQSRRPQSFSMQTYPI